MDDEDLATVHKVPSALIKAIKFEVLTGEDIEKISALEINAPGQVTCSDLGLPNSSYGCTTCGSKDRKSCEGHFGAIKFPFTILHPYFMAEIAEILQKICPACKSIRQEIRVKRAKSLLGYNNQPKGCKYCCGNGMGRYPAMKFRVSSNDFFRRTAIIVEVNDISLNKKRNLGRGLPADYWDFILGDVQQEENHVNRKVLSPVQVENLLSGVDPNFIEKFIPSMDLVGLSCFLVAPNCHRVTEVPHRLSGGYPLSFDNRTRACKKLVDFRGTANELSSRVLDCLRFSKINPDRTPVNIFTELQQRKVGENACNSSGLRWMKDVVLGKRNDCTFRTVVVGDPDLELSEIGIPCQIAEALQVSEYVNRQNRQNLLYCCELRLLEKGQINVRRNGNPVVLYKKEDLQIGDIFYRPLVDGDKVLINRPPSIHQHSMIALTVRVLPISSVVSINPICCSPLRGDFDGDCLHGYIPQSVGARVELNELVALDRQLINGQSGGNLLSLSQDSLTAAHLLLEDGVGFNIYQVQQLEMLCNKELTSPAIFKAPSSNTPFWSGKQLFSMLLPSKFDYAFPSNDVFVKDGELISCSESSGWLRDSENNVFQSLVEHFQGKILDVLHGAQKALCEWLSMTGFSVSLSDLYLSSDSYARKNMMEEISYGLRVAEQACDFNQLLVDHYSDFLSASPEENEKFVTVDVDRLNHERQISAAQSQASVDAFRHVFRNIQSLADKHACKDNSFLAMFKAGSKGNLLKLVQHSMCLGLQHSLVRLSYRIPRELSCAGWNSQKGLHSMEMSSDTLEPKQSYIAHAVVESSFLTGLNPLECFVHSVTNRDSSFSDNADLPGTLTRRLMFFMRDMYDAYDGTVRNLYGNQLIQFSYDAEEDSSCDSYFREDIIGGEPVGALSACAVSEAAYSALSQPISLLEASPLLNLKNVLECGSRKKGGDQTVSLFLSEKIGKQRNGFEYAALEVKNYLERYMFSNIVSTVMIIFTPQHCSQVKYSPWVCHFHLDKENVTRRKLEVHSIIDSLYQQYDSFRRESKVILPSLKISSKKWCVDYKANEGGETSVGNEKDGEDCITVAVVEDSKNSVQLDSVRKSLIPFLLQTAIKGFLEIKKVDILWKDLPKVTKSYNGSAGELYLRVTMSSGNDNGTFWGRLINHCHRIMPLIDWTRSHPDNIHHFCSAFGIDAGWQHYFHNLSSATSDTGKSILPKHLRLVANSLSASGEFVGLNAKGMARQRKHASVSSPFVQACFSNPGSSFLKAAKSGIVDNLQGNLDALAWGNCLPMGTGGQFDIIYSEKVEEINKSVDVYGLLETSFNQMDQEINIPQSRKYSSGKCSSDFRSKNGGYTPKEPKQWKSVLRNFMTANDIQRLTFDARVILNKYQIDETLSETDKLTIMKVLHFHPRRDEKFGSGPQNIKVGWHPEFTDSRCFFIIRKDGSVEDFSYRKCILGALDIIDPKKSKIQRNRWSGNGDMEAKKWSGNGDMEAKKWSGSYDKEAKKWSQSYDKEAKKWSGNDDVEVTSI
ncbi:putative DNA-directed RNA polymerase [Medicago truncatula]|uniref:DNA-directed RNA polymerase n=1 Tax=Medicago truncatula TaxID=3880 RepID=G7KER5_MEDTR|nr:DNA-directed RNA polymerase IV subunit 1 isoform X2 [Medicago truncatula]AES94122.2 DNA-directed RNA polymerase [Medicago truncatula]RHN53648.1 putative DNA-directed RNA polymerase [Medicago truncatula]